MNNLTRRDLLKVITNSLLALSGMLGVGGIFRFLSDKIDDQSPLVFNLGKINDYPSGTRVIREEIPAVVIRTEDGLQVLSMVCPHLGCTLEMNAQGFVCHCHGSRFDVDGNVVHGPAGQNLSRLRVTQSDNGEFLVTKD